MIGKPRMVSALIFRGLFEVTCFWIFPSGGFRKWSSYHAAEKNVECDAEGVYKLCVHLRNSNQLPAMLGQIDDNQYKKENRTSPFAVKILAYETRRPVFTTN